MRLQLLILRDFHRHHRSVRNMCTALATFRPCLPRARLSIAKTLLPRGESGWLLLPPTPAFQQSCLTYSKDIESIAIVTSETIWKGATLEGNKMAAERKDIFIFDTSCPSLNTAILKDCDARGLGAVLCHDEVNDGSLARAEGFKAVCIFVNKQIKKEQVKILSKNGNELILCCSAGFDNVPVDECKSNGISILRVPSYSPSSIAEYAVAALMSLCKHVQESYLYTKVGDFSIGGLQGILLEDKTVGIVGTGLIGKKTAEKISGLVKRVLCFDAFPNEEWIQKIDNAQYTELDNLYKEADFISIHVPLLPTTRYLINAEAIGKMKPGVLIVNTSRGEIVNSKDLLAGLDSKKIGGAALDVFENEKTVIFKDHSSDIEAFKGEHPDLEQMIKYPNIILSSHVAFFTDESVFQIKEKTLGNYEAFLKKEAIDEKAVVTLSQK